MILTLIGWVGSALLAVGLYQIGNQHRRAFLFSIAGEFLWIIKSLCLGMWDLAAICAVFLAMAIRAYCVWKEFPVQVK